MTDYDKKGYYLSMIAFGIMYIFFAIDKLGSMESLPEQIVAPTMWICLLAGSALAIGFLIKYNQC